MVVVADHVPLYMSRIDFVGLGLSDGGYVYPKIKCDDSEK